MGLPSPSWIAFRSGTGGIGIEGILCVENKIRVPKQEKAENRDFIGIK
jgi:hypothetical protein